MVTALKMNTVFAYTVVYVKDVAISTAIYSKAFGYSIRRLDGSNRCGGSWKAGKPLLRSHRYTSTRPLICLTGAVHTPTSGRERQPVEVCFAYRDVDAAYKRAVENGAVPVSEPEERESGDRKWGT